MLDIKYHKLADKRAEKRLLPSAFLLRLLLDPCSRQATNRSLGLKSEWWLAAELTLARRGADSGG